MAKVRHHRLLIDSVRHTADPHGDWDPETYGRPNTGGHRDSSETPRLDSFNRGDDLTGRIPQAAPFIHDAASYHRYFSAHVDRVTRLALYLYEQFPNRLRDIPSAHILRKYLEAHDAAKFSGLTHEDDTWKFEFVSPMIDNLSYGLFLIYGINAVARKEFLGPNLSSVIDRINAADRQATQDFFARHGITNLAQQNALRRLEHIADLVDRGCYGTAATEMDKTTVKLASQIFAEPNREGIIDEEAMAMARLLEDAYWQIIGPEQEIRVTRMLPADQVTDPDSQENLPDILADPFDPIS